jgi:hypothetical protein
MKWRHAMLAGAVVSLGALPPTHAYARGGGGFHGYGGGYPGVGFPMAPFSAGLLFGAALAPLLFQPPPPYCYAPPYYAPPAAVPAPVYVPPYPGQAVPQVPAYWYFCASAQLYHPYVQACPEGWQQIPRQPLF